MSDENETNNPYLAPATSDEPLAKQDAEGRKAKLNPVHWLLPILGYVYLPAIFILSFLEDYAKSQGQSGIAVQLRTYWEWLAGLSIFVLPIYVGGILICLQRHRKGTNTPGIKLYHGLSLILPLLWYAWVLFMVFLAMSGALM